jgi:hypothetical protein
MAMLEKYFLVHNFYDLQFLVTQNNYVHILALLNERQPLIKRREPQC